MANKNETTEIVTGLENAKTEEERKTQEYNLVESLLAAADFKNDEDLFREIEIRRDGKFFFKFTVRPVTEDERARCSKRATSYMKNPNNRKLPPIEKDFSQTLWECYLIYTATVPEDQSKIWGNSAVMAKFDLVEPAESVKLLLRPGEMKRVAEIISEISGIDDEELVSTEDYVKN